MDNNTFIRKVQELNRHYWHCIQMNDNTDCGEGIEYMEKLNALVYEYERAQRSVPKGIRLVSGE